jgi:hypothetical protein
MVLISVIDLPEKPYCTTDHIHFATTSTLVAFPLEKGRTYFVVRTALPERQAFGNAQLRIMLK